MGQFQCLYEVVQALRIIRRHGRQSPGRRFRSSEVHQPGTPKVSHHFYGQRNPCATNTADQCHLVLGEYTPLCKRLGHRGVRPRISGAPRHRRLQRVLIGGIRHPPGNGVLAAGTSHQQGREGVTIVTFGMHEATNAHVVALQRTHVVVGTPGLLPIGPVRRFTCRLGQCLQPGAHIQSRHPRSGDGELLIRRRGDPKDKRGFA